VECRKANGLWAFFVGIVAITIILTPLFAVLYHFQVMIPIFPDTQPWDTVVYVAAATFVVWLTCRSMFLLEGAVTDVLMLVELER
jgi:uncharacterized protein